MDSHFKNEGWIKTNSCSFYATWETSLNIFNFHSKFKFHLLGQR